MSNPPALPTHKMFCGVSQSGKTSVMLCQLEKKLLEEMDQYGEWFTSFSVVDAKGSSLWFGAGSKVDFDKESAFVWAKPESKESMLAAYRKIKAVSQLRAQRAELRMKFMREGIPYEPRPHIFVIEEWLMLLSHAKSYDLFFRDKQEFSLKERFKQLVEVLILGGLEDNIQIWLSTQYPDVEANGFAAQCRDNFEFNCCGGPVRGYDSISAAITNKYIVRLKADRDRLIERLEKARQKALWVMFRKVQVPVPEPGKPHQELLDIWRTPFIDNSIKSRIHIRGELPFIPSYDEASDSEQSEAVKPANVVDFPSSKTPGSGLSRGAEKLINFARRQGRKIRLQEAQTGISGEYGKAAVIKKSAEECVLAGLASLIPNPNYEGSYFFVLKDQGQEIEELDVNTG